MAQISDSRGDPIEGRSYLDIPVQTEKKRQYLSEFQTKNLLNDQIDYLLKQENWIPADWRQTNEYADPGFNYGQKITDIRPPEERSWSGYLENPQAKQNIYRIHGEDPNKLGYKEMARMTWTTC